MLCALCPLVLLPLVRLSMGTPSAGAPSIGSPQDSAASTPAHGEAKPQAAPLFLEDPSAFKSGTGEDATPLVVTTTCGSREKRYILEVNGGGLGLADFDADGDLDLLVVDGATLEQARSGAAGLPPRLFLNDGSGVFVPAGGAWTMAPGRFGNGCAIGDVNGDGWLDIVVTQWGPLRLFLNQNGQGLRETTEGAGLFDSRWSTSAALADIDRDGDLDLAVACYLAFDFERVPPAGGNCSWKGYPVMCGPEGLEPVHDGLFVNRGDGTFEDKSVERGYRPAQAGFGLGVSTLDIDLDGDTDVYVSNDSTPNHLWRNRGDGTFVEEGVALGLSHNRDGKEQASMGIGIGDLNGDERPDVVVTNFSGENNALYLSRKRNNVYSDMSSAQGVGGPSMPYLGWGTAMADYDLDGDLDIHVLNGHVYPEANLPGTDTTYEQVDQLYRNDGGKFSVETLRDGPARVSRASTQGDIDGDGDLDLIAIELDGPVRVLRNMTRERSPRTRWLSVAPRAAAGNRMSLGARVRVEWEGGAASREITSSGGYQSAVAPLAHFGLGSAARAKQVWVRFPSGREVTLKDVELDRELVVMEPRP